MSGSFAASSLRLGACLGLACAAAARAAAQTPAPVKCAGQTVSEIIVYASAPTVSGAARVPMLRDVVRAMHMTTDPELTRRYLLLSEGSPCTELRRAESERVLRAQPFIADATVLAYADSSGGVRVEVHTIDEASMLGGARMSGGSPFLGLVRLGNSNLLGQGVLASAEWRAGGANRDGYALSFADHQFIGQPWVLAVDMRRSPLGGMWNVEASHPFLTDLQASAWRAHAGEALDYVRLRQPEEDARGVPVYRAYADLGVLSRVGPPRRMALVGATISHERERTTNEMYVLDRFGARLDSGAPSMTFTPHTMARVNLLGGVRLLDYLRVRGFDGLSATQDFPIGLQAGAVVGRSLAALGSRDDDWFSSVDLYAAMGTTERATQLRLQGEGRYDREQMRWDGVAASGSVTHYARQGERNTTFLSADWAGGWRPRVPGQLDLGAVNGGLRGFAAAHQGGARRLAVTAEQRRVLGRVNGTAELGGALFVDAGRVWAGDVPLGLTSPWRASVGVSLLAAVPVRSSRLWRVDLAMPSTGGGIRRWEVRVTHAGPFSLSRVDRTPMNDMRARAVPASVFLWP